MESKLKKINSTGLIQNDKDGFTAITEYYDLSGTKFRIQYEHTENSPKSNQIDNKKTVAQYNSKHGRWDILKNISELNMDSKYPNCFDVEETKNHVNEFFNKAKTYLGVTYSK